MKKFNELNQKLKKLESQKKNLDSLENISILQFIKYKMIISEKSKISEQVKKITSLADEVNFWYDTNTKSWIENPKINCRKYIRLQRNAEFKRDLKLYKLGFLTEKPLPPFLKNNKHFFSRFNCFKKIQEKYNFFKSYLLPRKINNLAVNTAKIGITGYRKFQADCKFIRNFIASKNSIKYLKNVIKEANIQIEQSNSLREASVFPQLPKNIQFRESLKFSPKENIFIDSNTANNYPQNISIINNNANNKIRTQRTLGSR